MNVLADQIVEALLGEFQQAVRQLEASGSNVGVSSEARFEVVKQLCELSRDVRFHLGPAKYADEAQLSEVAKAFVDAVSVIQTLWKSSPAKVSEYCDNILERAKSCRH